MGQADTGVKKAHRQWVNMTIFTNTHKYENDPLAMGLLTYISAYALAQQITENLTKPWMRGFRGPKWTSVLFPTLEFLVSKQAKRLPDS